MQQVSQGKVKIPEQELVNTSSPASRGLNLWYTPQIFFSFFFFFGKLMDWEAAALHFVRNDGTPSGFQKCDEKPACPTGCLLAVSSSEASIAPVSARASQAKVGSSLPVSVETGDTRGNNQGDRTSSQHFSKSNFSGALCHCLCWSQGGDHYSFLPM